MDKKEEGVATTGAEDVEEEESNAGTTGAEDVEDVEDEEAEEGANTPGAGNPFGKFNLCSI